MKIDDKNNQNEIHREIRLPVSVFNNDSLSALEAITKYFKEELELNFSEIAKLLNRDDRTIWGAYESSKKKMPEPLSKNLSNYNIPILILKNRNLSVLESIIEYLKEEHGLRYCKIASILNRNDRTVWTVYNRAKKKRRKYVLGA